MKVKVLILALLASSSCVPEDQKPSSFLTVLEFPSLGAPYWPEDFAAIEAMGDGACAQLEVAAESNICFMVIDGAALPVTLRDERQ